MSRTRWQAVIFSVLLHVTIVAAGMFSVSFSSPVAMPRQLAIEATVVDLSVLENLDEARREEEEARERAAAEAARQLKEQEQREEDERRQREQELAAEQEAQRQEAEAKAEADRRAQEQLAEQERLAQEEAERQAREEAARQERERQAELKRQREAEQKRLAEAAARKKREEEARRQQEAEALLLAQLEEEERRLAAADAGLIDQYRLLITQKIQRSWLRPPSAQPGLVCQVSVTQLPSREVVDVRIGECNGDAATVRSIEAAVRKASPLPKPPDPSLFERKLSITFKPDE